MIRRIALLGALLAVASVRAVSAAPEADVPSRFDLAEAAKGLLARARGFRLPSTERKERRELFGELDVDPWLRGRVAVDSIAGLIDLFGATDAPPRVLQHYRRRAGTEGGARLLLALDYTRGARPESWLAAAKRGAQHLVSNKMITSRVVHSRIVGSDAVFPIDDRFPVAFRDSAVWGPPSNQVGHMLAAVEIGFAVAKIVDHPVKDSAVSAAIRVVDKAALRTDIEADPEGWARAILIGHELVGGQGILPQIRRYDELTSDGDPQELRAHFDRAVAAVMREDHREAWAHIDAIAAATGVPWTRPPTAGELEDHPRYGNSGQDLALSVYGYAAGLRAARGDFATPERLQEYFRDHFMDNGAQAASIEHWFAVGRAGD